MICEPCAAGGDLTRWPAPLFEAVRVLAAEEHARCPGPAWCPCQHVIVGVEVLAARRAAMPGGGLSRIAGYFADDHMPVPEPIPVRLPAPEPAPAPGPVPALPCGCG